MKFFYIIILIWSSRLWAQDLACKDWFVRENLMAGSKDCLLRCSSSKVGMGTFMCTGQCEKLCKPNLKSCEEVRKNWESKLTDGRPPSWPNIGERSKNWTTDEKERVLESLSVIPKQLWVPTVRNISRMDKSKDFPNPASNIPGIIILYDEAFKESLVRYLAHELAHQLYDNFSKSEQREYQIPMNWFPGFGNKWIHREEKYFVTDDSVLGPQEDFANNLEFFLFDFKKLKGVTEGAVRWIKDKYGDSFKLGEACVIKK